MPSTPAVSQRPRTAVKVAAPRLAVVRKPGAIARRAQVRHGLSPDGTFLYAGIAAVRLCDVESYDASGLSEKDYPTAFATMAIFSAVAGASIFAVVETGWRTKFLQEGVLFGAIALCAMVELFSARRRTLYTFEVVARSGDVLTFVTADAEEAQAEVTIILN